LIHAINQRFLGREVPEEILMCDAEALCEFAQTALEPHFRKEGDSALDDFPLSVFGRKAPPAGCSFLRRDTGGAPRVVGR
jgi:hypothetical protein